MTTLCRKSLVSLENCLDITEDNNKYYAAVAGVWNNFFDNWRGKDYDYLFIVANDTQADINAIDYMVKYMDNHEDVGVVTGGVERKLKKFKKNYGQLTTAWEKVGLNRFHKMQNRLPNLNRSS